MAPVTPFAFLHPREQAATILRRVYEFGMTTTSGGNLSLRDEQGNLWVTPKATDKGSIQPQDIVCIRSDGRVEGIHPPSSELPFHQAIYAARPDVGAILHAHPPALVSFSICRQVPDTRLLPQVFQVCGPLGYASYALPGSDALGRSIAAAFAQGCQAAIMENHGTVVVGEQLLTAFARFEMLEFCARTQLQAAELGQIHTLSEREIQQFEESRKIHWPEFYPELPDEQEQDLRRELIAFLHRAYRQGLIISATGAFSARLNADSFLITPTGLDRFYLRPEDLVLMQGGRRESGKFPSRAAAAHQHIYSRFPGVNAILFAQSPFATAYAIARKEFDTRTIPESYLLLRELPLAPHTALHGRADGLMDYLSPKTPVVLVENEAVVVIGQSLLDAFDRLEVAEFSAHSLTQARRLGPLQPIGPTEIQQLKERFDL